MLKAIHAQEDLEAAREKAKAVAEKLEEMRLGKAARIVREGAEETLTYMAFPREHWIRIRTNNPLERILKEVRRLTRVVGAFPDGQSALMLVAARLRHIAGTRWGTFEKGNMGTKCIWCSKERLRFTMRAKDWSGHSPYIPAAMYSERWGS